jgi:hypothetical protein
MMPEIRIFRLPLCVCPILISLRQQPVTFSMVGPRMFMNIGMLMTVDQGNGSRFPATSRHAFSPDLNGASSSGNDVSDNMVTGTQVIWST